MKLYYGKNKKAAKQITLEELLAKKLKNFKIKRDSFSDNSARWIDIIQQNEKSQITVVMLFTLDYEEIEEIEVFEAKVVTIVDEENMKKLI